MHSPVSRDYLSTFLSPLQPFLDRPDTTDLFVNGSGAIWVERVGGVIERHDMPLLTEDWLWQVARQMARVSHQGIDRTAPLLSASLPGGTRVQVVAPPATRAGFAMAFRRQVTADATLADLDRLAMFDDVATGDEPDPDLDLAAHYAGGDHVAFLAAAVARRKTIIVSGGTSSGKTTLVNALLNEIPAHERIIAIEDSAELALGHANAAGLIVSRGRMGEAGVTPDDMLQAALRLRPDRIVLGEVRGGEALTFLRAINTGHPGSLTTIHADSPRKALDQLAMLALQSGARIDAADLRRYVARLIDIVVQLERTPGVRRVSSIVWHRHDDPEDSR